MNTCRTTQSFFSDVSGCLVEKPECTYAQKLGFSYICTHPDHTKFYSQVTGAVAEIASRERYNLLRLKRRNQFIATLDETTRKNFCLQVNFLGQPLTNISTDC